VGEWRARGWLAHVPLVGGWAAAVVGLVDVPTWSSMDIQQGVCSRPPHGSELPGPRPSAAAASLPLHVAAAVRTLRCHCCCCCWLATACIKRQPMIRGLPPRRSLLPRPSPSTPRPDSRVACKLSVVLRAAIGPPQQKASSAKGASSSPAAQQPSQPSQPASSASCVQRSAVRCSAVRCSLPTCTTDPPFQPAKPRSGLEDSLLRRVTLDVY
jgi:hypothetical protein